METRLQTLRRLRSERRLLEVAAEIALLQRAGWACVGCGCSIDDYSLDCARCWDRARRHKDGRWRPEMQASAWCGEKRCGCHGACIDEPLARSRCADRRSGPLRSVLMIPWSSLTLAFWQLIFANYDYDEIEALKALYR